MEVVLTGGLTKEMWDEVHGEIYKRMGMEYKPMTVYGTYIINEGSLLLIEILDVDYCVSYVEYREGEIVNVYKTAQEDKDFIKKYPYWVVREDYPYNVCGFMPESSFRELLPYMKREYRHYTRNGRKDLEENHEGMIYNPITDEWRWL